LLLHILVFQLSEENIHRQKVAATQTTTKLMLVSSNLSLILPQGYAICWWSVMPVNHDVVCPASNGEQAIARVCRHQLQQHAGIAGRRPRPMLQWTSVLRRAGTRSYGAKSRERLVPT